jgi:hypothetical protein
MKRELRIVDGICKVVNVDKKGEIVKVLKDYKNQISAEEKIRNRVEFEKIRLTKQVELDKKQVELDKKQVELDKKQIELNKEFELLKEKVDEYEKNYEIHNRKRRIYQVSDTETKELGNIRKRVLKKKVKLGIIHESALDIKTNRELLDIWAKKRGCYNYSDYLDMIAFKRGYFSYEEYMKMWDYFPGMTNPYKENRTDNRFLGVYIGENAIHKIYEGSERKKLNNKGYDIICQKGYKIDVKTTILSQYNTYVFDISKNKTADYFVMIGFNNIIDLKPLHIWIIRGNEKLDTGRIVNDLNKFIIVNEPFYISKYEKYEKYDKLELLKTLCNEFDAKNKIEIRNYYTTRQDILGIIGQIRKENSYHELHRNPNLYKDILIKLEQKKKERQKKKVLTIIQEDECLRPPFLI